MQGGGVEATQTENSAFTILRLTQRLQRSETEGGGHQSGAETRKAEPSTPSTRLPCRPHVTSKGEICVSHLVMVVRKAKKKKNCVAAGPTLNNERPHAVADSDGKPREEFRASHPASLFHPGLLKCVSVLPEHQKTEAVHDGSV